MSDHKRDSTDLSIQLLMQEKNGTSFVHMNSKNVVKALKINVLVSREAACYSDRALQYFSSMYQEELNSFL